MCSSPFTVKNCMIAKYIGDVRVPALRAGKGTLRSSPAADS